MGKVKKGEKKVEQKVEKKMKKDQDKETVPAAKVDKMVKNYSRGLMYIGHIPHGFYEEEMKGYFEQFGTVTKVRVARSKKVEKSYICLWIISSMMKTSSNFNCCYLTSTNHLFIIIDRQIKRIWIHRVQRASSS